jgi:hypothetical protein
MGFDSCAEVQVQRMYIYEKREKKRERKDVVLLVFFWNIVKKREEFERIYFWIL